MFFLFCLFLGFFAVFFLAYSDPGHLATLLGIAMASSTGGRRKRLVSSLDGDVLSQLSMKLNPRMLLKDYQTLAGKLKYTYEYIRNFALWPHSGLTAALVVNETWKRENGIGTDWTFERHGERRCSGVTATVWILQLSKRFILLQFCTFENKSRCQSTVRQRYARDTPIHTITI